MSIRRHYPAILFLVFLLAFFLRAWQIDLVQYGIDEGTASAICTQVAHLRYFPLTGIETSFGFHNPPLLFYLFAPVFRLTRDPRGAQFVVALLASLAPLAAARGAALMGGRRAGVLAAILVAVCPNAVEHGRRFWGVDTTVFWSSLAFWLAIEAVRRRRWQPLALSFCAAITSQALHLSGVLLWFPGLVVLLLGHRMPGRLKALAVAFVWASIVYTPWLVSEIQSGFTDTRLVLAHLAGGTGKSDLGLSVSPLAAWALVLGDFWSNDLLGGGTRSWMASRGAAIGCSGVTVGALLFLGLGLGGSLSLVVRKTRWRLYGVLLGGGIFLPMVVFAVLMRASVPPYFLPSLVPAMIGAAFWISRRLPQSLGTSLVAVYTLFSLILVVALRLALTQGAGTSISLREKMAIVDEISRRGVGATPYVMQDGRNPDTGIDVAYVYLLYWADLSDGIPSRPRDADTIFVIVDRRTRLRPEVAVYLRQFPPAESVHLQLHQIPRDRIPEWLAVLRAFPAPR